MPSKGMPNRFQPMVLSRGHFLFVAAILGLFLTFLAAILLWEVFGQEWERPRLQREFGFKMVYEDVPTGGGRHLSFPVITEVTPGGLLDRAGVKPQHIPEPYFLETLLELKRKGAARVAFLPTTAFLTERRDYVCVWLDLSKLRDPSWRGRAEPCAEWAEADPKRLP